MDGVTTPRKRIPSLSSPKLSAVPNSSLSGSRETNENEQPPEQKPMTKHFMSPTISAASKASVSRKKILAEKNEISSSCESHPHNKASIFGSKTNSLYSTSHRSGKLPISSCNYTSESDDEQQNNFVVESSYKPYDPVTNYLAPRPKYLRYQPSRRRGVIPRQEDLSRYENDDAGFKERGSLDSQEFNDNLGSLDPSNPTEKHEDENGVSVEDDEEVEENVVRDGVDVEDDEEMEDNVDSQWDLKGLFKILLLLIVFLLAGSDLSSTKSMVTSDTCNIIRKNMFEAVSYEIYGSGSYPPEYSPSGILELSQGAQTDYELQAVSSVVGFLNVEAAEMEETTEPQKEHSADIDIEQDSTDVEVTHSLHGNEEETLSTVVSEATTFNEVDEEEVEDSDEQLQRDQTHEVKLAASSFEQAEDDHNVEQVERISQGTTGEEEFLETELEGAEEIDMELETSNLDNEMVSKDVEVQGTGQSNTVIIVGVSAASVLLASLVILYVSRKRRASVESPRVTGVLNPVIASVEGELIEGGNTQTSVKVPSLHESLIDPSENLRSSQLEGTPGESITQTSSLFASKKEASKEISHISAPNVELLGEMVVEVTSSLRSCVRKTSVIEPEESNTYSSNSIGKAAISHSAIPPAAQPAVVDHSISDSPSYGSFTAEKKIIKKKVEQDGEEIKKVVLTTPVRRSSRIRDRAIMSP